MPITTSRAPRRGRQLDQLVDHRHGHVEALDRELLLAQVGLVHEALERVDLGQPLEQRLLLVVGQRLAERARTRSPRAATAAGGGRRCARSRRRSSRSRSRAGAAARRRASPRARTCAGSGPGSAPSAPGSGPSGSGSSDGSPSGSRPSGSRWAARWPWVRWALSSEVAAWTACMQSPRRARRSGCGGGAAGAARRPRPAARGAGAAARAAPGRVDAEVGEDLLVEAVLALQQRLDALQEAAGLGALDDPVVVGRGHGHDLLGADLRRRSRSRPTG